MEINCWIPLLPNGHIFVQGHFKRLIRLEIIIDLFRVIIRTYFSVLIFLLRTRFCTGLR